MICSGQLTRAFCVCLTSQDVPPVPSSTFTCDLFNFCILWHPLSFVLGWWHHVPVFTPPPAAKDQEVNVGLVRTSDEESSDGEQITQVEIIKLRGSNEELQKKPSKHGRKRKTTQKMKRSVSNDNEPEGVAFGTRARKYNRNVVESQVESDSSMSEVSFIE